MNNFGSCFRELRNNFGLKFLKFFDADPYPGFFLTLDPGSGLNHSGSTTLIIFADR
jgi:hypothetical protein